MLFKDLKPGYPVFIMHKEPEISISQAKVNGNPTTHWPQNGGINNPMQMMVDVTLEENGVTQTYTIPYNLSITYTDNGMVLSTESEGIIRELEAMKNHSEEEIIKVPKHKKIIASCDKLLAEWSPTFKEKAATEERFNKIEGSINELKNLILGLANHNDHGNNKG